MTLLLAAVLGVLLVVLYRLFVSPRQAEGWVAEHFVATDYGLPPREALDSRRAGPPAPAHRRSERQAVADAAWAGDWKGAARYVREAGEDWDERWARLELLQHVAQEDDAWFDAWRAAEPGDCDAATLNASLMVHRAWEIRGSGYAHEVMTSDMERFKAMLPAAIEEARRAALLDPANPGPWVVMITAARGAQYDRARFKPLWEGLVARAPHHYEGHWQALQYWCAKWFGSDRRMMRFARRAVRKAPPGSPLAGIYLHALNELTERSGSDTVPATPRAKSVLKQVAASFDRVDPDDERLPVLRHLLAHYMLRSMMYAPALEQFRLIGPWCGAQPWRKDGNPVAAFETARGTAARLSRTRPAPVPRTHGIGH
ncbi:hypothetical protein [Streptomyces sp. CC208A]|uniref:hypothetical protein n=1 Tax=Streptomyces sp. CC208A TaxID=3044573 RepID=UPI0024A8E0A8|nr:hypothetical protein [Streptomyces sp. CC208A]